jgi:hypothetical protein
MECAFRVFERQETPWPEEGLSSTDVISKNRNFEAPDTMNTEDRMGRHVAAMEEEKYIQIVGRGAARGGGD